MERKVAPCAFLLRQDISLKNPRDFGSLIVNLVLRTRKGRDGEGKDGYGRRAEF